MSEPGAVDVVDPAAAEPGTARRFKRFFLLLLFFVVVGPPVGSVVLFTLIAIAKIQTPADAAYALLSPFVGLLFSPFSYFYGAVPAALGGAVVAGWQAFRGPVSVMWIVALGSVLGLAVVGVAQVIADPAFEGMDWRGAGSMFLTTALPALICWYLMRNRFYPPTGSGPNLAESGA